MLICRVDCTFLVSALARFEQEELLKREQGLYYVWPQLIHILPSVGPSTHPCLERDWVSAGNGPVLLSPPLCLRWRGEGCGKGDISNRGCTILTVYRLECRAYAVLVGEDMQKMRNWLRFKAWIGPAACLCCAISSISKSGVMFSVLAKYLVAGFGWEKKNRLSLGENWRGQDLTLYVTSNTVNQRLIKALTAAAAETQRRQNPHMNVKCDDSWSREMFILPCYFFFFLVNVACRFFYFLFSQPSNSHHQWYPVIFPSPFRGTACATGSHYVRLCLSREVETV